MNNIVLAGRLTLEHEIRKAGDKTVLKNSLAVDRIVNGERKADFIPIEAWGKTGEVIYKYAHKGDKLAVAGQLHIDQYEKDGQKRSFAYVTVTAVDLLECKKKDEENPFS